MSVRLSVNVNKIATLRNSRGGDVPNVIEAVRVCIGAGAPGITVHPRADARHIRTSDVVAIAEELAPLRSRVEFNIEGDPRPDLMALVHEVAPHQCTLVPVVPGELTSQAGWRAQSDELDMRRLVDGLKARGIRVSIFVDAEVAAVRWAASMGADRVELFTEPFARAFAAGEAEAQRSFSAFVSAAAAASDAGLGVNAGHDLDLENLRLFRRLPHLAEVSIGHALVSRAVFVGLDRVVREYLAVLADGSAA